MQHPAELYGDTHKRELQDGKMGKLGPSRRGRILTKGNYKSILDGSMLYLWVPVILTKGNYKPSALTTTQYGDDGYLQKGIAKGIGYRIIIEIIISGLGVEYCED